MWEADQLVCGICGNLREDCADPNAARYPQRHKCYAKREQEAADRLYGEKHKDKPFTNRAETRWAEKPDPQTPFHFRDGVRIFVAPVDLDPDDHFL